MEVRKKKKWWWRVKSVFQVQLRSKSLPATKTGKGSRIGSPPPSAGAPAVAAVAVLPPGAEAGDVQSTAGQIDGIAGKSLVVHILQARRLRAADSNGLSDPYVVVKVGSHKSSSKTELKTLEPRWNETMCFSPADVEEAVEDGRPQASFRVFDWDMVSADDFLGQCEIPFADIDPHQAGPAAPMWLPLYGFERGKKVDAGEIQVAAWFEAGSGHGQQGGSTVSTMCFQPGTKRRVPQVVHCQQGILYEEPLIVCLAVTLDRVEHVPVSTRETSGSSWFEGRPLAPAFSGSGGSISIDGARSAASFAGTQARLIGGRLGRLFHRRHGGGGGSLGGHGLTRSNTLSSTVSDAMLAGEDAGDEYEALMFYDDGKGRYAGGAADTATQAASYDEVEDEVDEEDKEDDESPSGTPRTPDRWRRSSTDEGQQMDEAFSSPDARPDPSAGGEADSLSGKRMYVKLVLGRQQHTSFIKKEHHNGTVNWHQTFSFAAPLPLRDRQLRLELYRTTSSTQRGRLMSITHVWLRDLLPPDLADNLHATKHTTLPLRNVVKGRAASRMLLTSTAVDADMRRRMYQAAFVEEAPNPASLAATAAGAAAATVPTGTAAAGAAGSSSSGGAGGGDGEAARRPAAGELRRLESFTEEYTDRELRKKALKSEQSYVAWKDSHHHRARSAATGLFPRAAGRAYRGWQYMTGQVPSLAQPASEGDPAAEVSDDGSLAAAGAPLPLAAALPEPAGSVLLTVQAIRLAGTNNAESFCVLKCGPYWGRSSTLNMSGGRVECGWQLSLPVLDPSSLLSLVVFQQPTRGLRGARERRTSFLLAPAAQVAGKLRVRLSCLLPNALLSADLPLLGERAKGAHVVGSAQLSLQCSYSSMKALVKGYTAPRLPAPAYHHGVADRVQQAVMERESRRIVLRWLDSANPSISGVTAMAVLDTEREAFVMSRTRVNWRRIRMALVGVRRFQRKFQEIKTWQHPWLSVAATVAIFFLCFLPRLAVPALLAWVVCDTLAAMPADAGLPVGMQRDPPDIDPEHETLETSTVNPLVNLRARVERLQRLGLLAQNLLDDVACFMERCGALLSWQDPTATALTLAVLSVVAGLIFLLGPSTVIAFVLCFIIRHPALRTPTPPVPAVFFSKLPSRRDSIV